MFEILKNLFKICKTFVKMDFLEASNEIILNDNKRQKSVFGSNFSKKNFKNKNFSKIKKFQIHFPIKRQKYSLSKTRHEL